MNELLLIDTNYLCYRAFYAMGELAHEGAGTGAIFGVLRDIVALQDNFQTTRCVFAFDTGRSNRAKLLPTYKATRRKKREEENEEEKQARENFGRQVGALRKDYLPAVGFKNVFAARGFEADDIIASITTRLPGNVEAVVVGSDKDFYQLLRPNVYCWNPQKQRAYTAKHFRAEWGMEPDEWADVKAYAGCSTDDVPGVPGVGEKTAAKYLCGALGAHTKAYKKLEAARVQYAFNMRLVQLPYPGTPEFVLQEDEVTEEKWVALADRLGMRSLRDNAPRGAARKSKGRKRKRGRGGVD